MIQVILQQLLHILGFKSYLLQNFSTYAALKQTASKHETQNQVFIVLEVLRRSVQRIAGPVYAA